MRRFSCPIVEVQNHICAYEHDCTDCVLGLHYNIQPSVHSGHCTSTAAFSSFLTLDGVRDSALFCRAASASSGRT